MLFLLMCRTEWCYFFFFNDTATTEIYTLSLHDALPISGSGKTAHREEWCCGQAGSSRDFADRKSTRLNSSHSQISYAVFCLKKKNEANDLPRNLQWFNPITLHFLSLATYDLTVRAASAS